MIFVQGTTILPCAWGVHRVLLQDAKSAITANKTARGSHSYTESLTLFPLPLVPMGVWLHSWSFSIQSGARENYSHLLNGSEHQWGVGVLLGLLSSLGLLAFK